MIGQAGGGGWCFITSDPCVFSDLQCPMLICSLLVVLDISSPPPSALTKIARSGNFLSRANHHRRSSSPTTPHPPPPPRAPTPHQYHDLRYTLYLKALVVSTQKERQVAAFSDRACGYYFSLFGVTVLTDGEDELLGVLFFCFEGQFRLMQMFHGFLFFA